jgi:hypothetical protein
MLLGQSAGASELSLWLFIVAFVAAATFIFGVLLIALLLRHSWRGRQLLHTERMRAIETGHSFEAPDPTTGHAKFMHNAFWISFWMVFGVPGAAFSAATAAMEESGGQLALGLAIWICAGAASVAAVVCATILMVQSRFRQVEDFSPREKRPTMTKPEST